LSRALKPGDLLPEGQLIAELKVSRTVLREAIKVLTAKGLVESKPRIGTRVRPRNQWNLLDPDILAWQRENGLDEQFIRKLAEVRRILEPMAAKLAAERASEEEIKLLEESYEKLAATVVNSEAFVDADMQLHFGILTACHNEILEQMGVAIREALQVSRKITVELPGASASSLPLHKAVVEAIRERDAPGAKRAMERLVERVENDINRFFQKTDPHPPLST
jgi:DNA-binding FadR family transcriptional regulator